MIFLSHLHIPHQSTKCFSCLFHHSSPSMLPSLYSTVTGCSDYRLLTTRTSILPSSVLRRSDITALCTIPISLVLLLSISPFCKKSPETNFLSSMPLSPLPSTDP